MELTKKLKAEVMANAISFGYFDYFDRIEYKPHLGKYRYYSAGDERIHYCSQQELANAFDNYVDANDRDDLIEHYFSLNGQL